MRYALIEPNTGRVAQIVDDASKRFPCMGTWVPAGDLEVDDKVTKNGKLIKRHAFKVKGPDGPKQKGNMPVHPVKA